MKIIHYALALLILCAGFVVSAEDYSAEVFVFGRSSHSNRNVRWNENNTGLAVGVSYHITPHLDLMTVGGGYKDSYDEWAKFAMIGPRVIVGDHSSFHATAAVVGGYMKGSGADGGGAMPVASLGYDWLDVCVSFIPAHKHSHRMNRRSQDPQDNRGVATDVVAFFINIRVANF